MKVDLQGWGIIIGASQSILNKGLEKVPDEIPAQYRSINLKQDVKIPSQKQMATAKLEKVALGVVRVQALLSAQKRLKVNIPFEGGKFWINNDSYSLQGAVLEVEGSLIAFKLDSDHTGQTYDVHLNVREKDVIFKVFMHLPNFPQEYLEFLNLLIKVAIQSIEGKSYKIYSFKVNYSDTNKYMVATEVESTFVLDEQVNNNSLFCVLFSTALVTTPTSSNRYDLSQGDVMHGQTSGIVLSVNNKIFISILRDNITKKGPLAGAHFDIHGDSPASLMLKNSVSNFAHGAELTACELTAEEGRLHLTMNLHKSDVSPGISMSWNIKAKLKPNWNGKTLTFVQDGEPDVHHSMSKAWWVWALQFIPGLGMIVSNIVIASIETVIEHSVPDFSNSLDSMLKKVDIPVKLPMLSIKGANMSTFQINRYGSFSVGLDYDEEN